MYIVLNVVLELTVNRDVDLPKQRSDAIKIARPKVLYEVKVKTTVFWNLLLSHSRQAHFYHQDGGKNFLRNIGE
jgi:hypothetical protein